MCQYPPPIVEYSATKIYVFSQRQKKCEKVSPYFSLSGVEKCQNLHFFGIKVYKFALLGVKISPNLNFFHLLLFSKIFSYVQELRNATSGKVLLSL